MRTVTGNAGLARCPSAIGARVPRPPVPITGTLIDHRIADATDPVTGAGRRQGPPA